MVCYSPTEMPPDHPDSAKCFDCQKSENILLGQDYHGHDLVKGGLQDAWRGGVHCKPCSREDPLGMRPVV